MSSLNDMAKAAWLKLEPGSRLMGLDLGSKSIGVATSDLTRQIATPRMTLARTKFSKDCAHLLEFAKAEAIGLMVLGLPLNMDGSEGPRCQSARAFHRNFAKLSAIPVVFWDERLSTVAVTRSLLEADVSRAKRAEHVDKLAAAYILQSFLDAMR